MAKVMRTLSLPDKELCLREALAVCTAPAPEYLQPQAGFDRYHLSRVSPGNPGVLAGVGGGVWLFLGQLGSAGCCTNKHSVKGLFLVSGPSY